MTDAADESVIDDEESASRAALRASDPAMARLVDTLEPVDLKRWRARWRLDSFRALARAIAGQQISGRAAEAIFGRLDALIGGVIRPRRWLPRATRITVRSVFRRTRWRHCATWPLGRSTVAWPWTASMSYPTRRREPSSPRSAASAPGPPTSSSWRTLADPTSSRPATSGSGELSSGCTDSIACRVRRRSSAAARSGDQIARWRQATYTRSCGRARHEPERA